jgi:hypothetical protein
MDVSNVGENTVPLKSNATSVLLGIDAAVSQKLGQEMEFGVSANEVELPSLFPVSFTRS